MSPLNAYSPKILSLENVITTSFHINTMVTELEGNLGKNRKVESEMLKPDVGGLSIRYHSTIQDSLHIYICNTIQ